MVERVACDNSDDMKINASAFEERDATHGPFVCSGAAARFAVSIVNAGGAIDAHAHANSSLLNKIAPFLVDQSGVSLEGVGDSNPSGGVTRDDLKCLAIPLPWNCQRFSSVPDESDLFANKVRGEYTLHHLAKGLLAHAIGLGAVRKVTIIAIDIAKW